MEKKTLKVAFYIRVSTDEQVKEGYGLQYQRDALIDLIKFKENQEPSWTTDKKYWYVDDGCSGGDLNRSAYKEMMLAAKNKEFDIIAVWKIDRMSRNLTHLLKTFEELRGYGVSFFSLKENIDFSGPVGRLTFQIFGALAEFEREMIKSRTNEGKRASARRGNYIGNGIPYGYDRKKRESEKGVKLVVVPKEAKILKNIFEWFVYDRLHYSEIAKKLNDLGVPKGVASRQKLRNTLWQQSTIKRMLENTSYIGVRVERLKDDDGKIEEIEVKVPDIVNRELFLQAELRMQEEKEDKRFIGGGKNKYLLARKVIDPITGKALVGYTRRDASYGYRRKAVYDKITKEKLYENIDITGVELDNFIWGMIEKAIRQPNDFFKLYKKQVDTGLDIDRLNDQVENLKVQIGDKELKIENIENDYYDGKINETKKEKYINQTNKEISKLELDLHTTEEKIDNILKINLSKEAIKRASKNLNKNLDNITMEQKRVFIDIMVDKIIVTRVGKDIKVGINFKFDLPETGNSKKGDEQKNSTSIKKDKGTKYVSCDNGRKRETRTHNPTFPKKEINLKNSLER